MPISQVILIDDHAMFRTGLKLVLSSAIADLEVLEAGSLDEATRLNPASPRMILLDIQLNGVNGLAGISLLQRKWPEVPIIMLSANISPVTMQEAKERGAVAYISKEESAESILAVVRQVLSHDSFTLPAPGTPPKNTQTLRLSPRQCEVLELLCQGLSNKVIGQRLGLSENTVRSHVQTLLLLLRVSSRAEAAYAARCQGLIN